MPRPPHAQSLVHRDHPRQGGGCNPEDADGIAPYYGEISGMVMPGYEEENEIRFVLQELNESGQTGIVFLEAVIGTSSCRCLETEPRYKVPARGDHVGHA
jgi:hypothetical protein